MKNSDGFLLIIVVFIGVLIGIILLGKNYKQDPWQDNYKKPTPDQFVPKHPEPKPPDTPEPEWTNYQPLRTVTNLGKVLSDIESHMPAGHIYRDSDKITWGHETSHGIASQLRMKFSRYVHVDDNGKKSIRLNGHWTWQRGKPVFKSSARINGFYVLNNRAVIIDEPNTTIRATARLVPQSLRGDVYNLYLVQQAASWNNTPLYLNDEHVAYSNGSAVRKDLGITSRAETVQYMFEFNVYVISLAMAIKQHDPSYDDAQLKAFIMWSIARSMNIYENETGAANYWKKFQTVSDAVSLREFANQYFGQQWCERYMWQTSIGLQNAT